VRVGHRGRARAVDALMAATPDAEGEVFGSGVRVGHGRRVLPDAGIHVHVGRPDPTRHRPTKARPTKARPTKAHI
jgi:hypothetical protein